MVVVIRSVLLIFLFLVANLHSTQGIKSVKTVKPSQLCTDNQYFLFGQCKAKLGVGELCYTENQCLTNICINMKCNRHRINYDL